MNNKLHVYWFWQMLSLPCQVLRYSSHELACTEHKSLLSNIKINNNLKNKSLPCTIQMSWVMLSWSKTLKYNCKTSSAAVYLTTEHINQRAMMGHSKYTPFIKKWKPTPTNHSAANEIHNYQEICLNHLRFKICLDHFYQSDITIYFPPSTIPLLSRNWKHCMSRNVSFMNLFTEPLSTCTSNQIQLIIKPNS